MSDFRDYGGIILGCVAIGGYLAFGGISQLQTGQQTRSQLAEIRQQNTADIALQRVEQEKLEQAAAIAEERYQEGCLVVFVGDPATGQVSNNYAAIIDNHPVFDIATNAPLAAGTVVCDANGMTAIIDADLKASSLAATQNRAIVQAVLDDYWKQGNYLGQTQE